MDTSTKILRLLTALAFIVILSVVPFCFYREHLGNVWVAQQRAAGIDIKHEGLEYLLLFVFGLYSIPFLFWAVYIFRKTKAKKFIDLGVIILVAVIPALFLNYFFFRALYH